MRLATITNWAYGVTVALTLASGATMLLASSAQDRERAAVEQRYALDQATSGVDEDVGALSGLARQFAISGGTADLTAYQREAAVLGAVEERTRHIRDAGASADELAALHEALRWADALGEQQQKAIAARRAGDRNSAIDILFAPEYEREIDRVQASIEHFQYRIDQRTDAALQAAGSTSRLWRSVSEIVLAMTGILFLCVLFFVFRQRVLRPVVKLSDVVGRLAAQDYAAEPPAYGQIDEIGDISQALRVFRENGLERQRLERERDADRAVRDLLSRMTQRMQSCDTTSELQNVVQRFMPEVLPQLAGRLYLLDGARGAMAEAVSWSAPVHSTAEFSSIACWALRRGSPHRAAGGHFDVPCDHLRHDGADVPDTICLPLAGQHGTLGLLYFERRADAPAGEIPEIYLEALTENVSLALDNLRLRDALHALAMADPLTTLANRRQLEETLEHHLAESERTGSPISCAMIDVDHFKRFNDDFGHDAGDAVLRAVGETLQKSVREGHLVFRYGGEEFLVLMPGIEAAAAAERAEEIRLRIAALSLHHGGQALGGITASFGVATAPAQCNQASLVKAADAALLRAKRAGRNRVVTASARKAALTGS
jgi:diguanylate cyclase (GGDEF)-like protein